MEVNYVEVFIWRARDEEGYVTTSSEGARLEQKADSGFARVGHGALNVVKNNIQTYMSLWPNVHGIGTQRAVLVKNLDEEKSSYEGADPDVIVRLYNLNINKILQAFKEIKKRVSQDNFGWTWKASDTDDIIDKKCDKASCVSFVWSMLKQGGIDSLSPYKENWTKVGPKDSDFYRTLKCNLAQVLWGYFDGYSWTEERPSNWGFSITVVVAAIAMAAMVSMKK
jgi:hypothetical protein